MINTISSIRIPSSIILINIAEESFPPLKLTICFILPSPAITILLEMDKSILTGVYFYTACRSAFFGVFVRNHQTPCGNPSQGVWDSIPNHVCFRVLNLHRPHGVYPECLHWILPGMASCGFHPVPSPPVSSQFPSQYFHARRCLQKNISFLF